MYVFLFYAQTHLVLSQEFGAPPQSLSNLHAAAGVQLPHPHSHLLLVVLQIPAPQSPSLLHRFHSTHVGHSQLLFVILHAPGILAQPVSSTQA